MLILFGTPFPNLTNAVLRLAIPDDAIVSMETAIKDKDVQGLKYFAKFLSLLDRLREKGCERDTAGNRQIP